MPSPGRPPAQPGWYPDPGGSAAHRYWDGTRWTDALSSAIPPAGPTNARDDRRTWALMAHLSALPSMLIAMAFIGPLLVYAMKKDDPYIRSHAAAALNFQLSTLVYVLGIGFITIVALAGAGVGVGVGLMFAVVIVFAIAWFVLICIAAVQAGEGKQFRYPLAIPFVR